MALDSWIGFDHELRRVVPRQPVDWKGFYALEGDQSGYWRECRFVDISPAGAGLVLLAVQLRAEVKNITEEAGVLRAGTQFVGLSSSEQEYLLSMARIGTRW